MDTKTEFKFYLKRIEPIDLFEDTNECRIEYIYSMKSHQSNYLSVERTISRNSDPVESFGIWLSKFYKHNEIVMFYKNYKYTFDNEKVVKKVKMFG